MTTTGKLTLVLATMLIATIATPCADVPDPVAGHPQWPAVETPEDAAGEAVRRYLARGGSVRTVVDLLDVLHEARSFVAEGDHGRALMAYLQLPRKARKPLRKWIEAQQDEVRRVHARDDVDELLQVQSRISVIVSELAGRREELRDPERRRDALRDLGRLSRFTDAALWERHELNWRLRGPLRLGSATADRAVERYYREHEREPFRSPDRSAYVKVLSRVEGGGFDAINGYDWGGISIGLAQFSASGPYLGQLLQHLERERPELYRRHVAGRGLSFDEEGWLYLGGRPLLSAIRQMPDQNEFNTVLLAFIECFETRRLRRSLYRQQVVVVDRMLDRAMELATEDGQRLSGSMSSPRGLAHLADAFVNTGADDTLEAFREARRQADGPGTLVEAFIEARRRFYERTGQEYQLDRIRAIEETFGIEVRGSGIPGRRERGPSFRLATETRPRIRNKDRGRRSPPSFKDPSDPGRSKAGAPRPEERGAPRPRWP